MGVEVVDALDVVLKCFEFVHAGDVLADDVKLDVYA
jgi:hypothetical protein